MANRLLLANYRFVIDGAAVIGPEPRIGKGKALIDMRLGSTSKLLPDKGALGRSPYGWVQNRQRIFPDPDSGSALGPVSNNSPSEWFPEEAIEFRLDNPLILV